MSHRSWINAPGPCSVRLEHVGQGLYVSVVDITRPLARDWLPDDGEAVWRKRSDPQVSKIIAHLESGAWVLDGNTIKFDEHGKLQDGQHRLTAVSITGIVLKSLVVMGTIQQHPNLDTGLPRSLADFLRHLQKGLAPLLAAILRMHVVWERTGGNFSEYYSAKMNPPMTNELCLEVLERCPQLEDAAKFGQRYGSTLRTLMSPTAISHLWYILTRESPDEAVDRFFAGVSDSTRLPKTDPRAALRRWLERRVQQGKIAGGQVSKDVPTFHAITLKAWNALVQGEGVDNLRWSRFAKKPELFPIPLVWDEGSMDIEDL